MAARVLHGVGIGRQLSLWPDATYDGNRTRHFRRQRDAHRVWIETPQWKMRARALIRERGNRCEHCLEPALRDGRRNKWLVVNHLSYDRLRDEWPEDLEVLCRECHEQYHEPLWRGC